MKQHLDARAPNESGMSDEPLEDWAWTHGEDPNSLKRRHMAFVLFTPAGEVWIERYGNRIGVRKAGTLRPFLEERCDTLSLTLDADGRLQEGEPEP